MKLILLVIAIVAYVAADESDYKYKEVKQIPILNQKYEIAPDGSEFEYLYETGNKINVHVAGKVNGIETDTADLETEGEVSYESPEGKPITWKFRSGVNGYEPEGDIVPTPPPTPGHVLRLLEFLQGKPEYVDQPTFRSLKPFYPKGLRRFY